MSTATTTIDSTSTGYDEAVAVADLQHYPSPLSLRPNESLMMACIYGRSFYGQCRNPLASGWGAYTEITEQAEAVRDSWRFCQSRATRVVYVSEKPTQNIDWFIGSGGTLGSTTGNKARTYANRVTSEELDAVYTEFLAGEKTDFEVLKLAQPFINRMAKLEYATIYAREHDHEEDVASAFQPVALEKIRAEACTGSSLAAYLANAFRNFSVRSFEKAKKEAARVESYSDSGFEDEEGNYTNPAIDDYSVALAEAEQPVYRKLSPGVSGSIVETTTLPLDSLSDKERRVAELYMQGSNQKQIAVGLKLTRHQVARSEKQIAKKLCAYDPLAASRTKRKMSEVIKVSAMHPGGLHWQEVAR